MVSSLVPLLALLACTASQAVQSRTSVPNQDATEVLVDQTSGAVNKSIEELFCPHVAEAETLVQEVTWKVQWMVAKNKATPRMHRIVATDWSMKPRRCSVVSSSGVLLNHTYGDMIDAADLVFRFNDAEVGSAVATIAGKEDDIRLLNLFQEKMLTRPSRAELPGSDHALYVIPKISEKAISFVTEEAGRLHPGANVVQGNKLLIKTADEILEAMYGTRPRTVSTGFYGILTAMVVCDEVHAYGFAESKLSAQAPQHYYATRGVLPKAALKVANLDMGHPNLDMERNFWRMISRSSDVAETDITVLPGFRSLRCV
mmetsp:Transcript_45180/g.104700  ORF Transcript_45180/g.104700 Transcript_45180/m.104700 type:complete len:315 (-) Transcript_45180:166-1110(-)